MNHISKVCSDVAKSVEFCELGGGRWGVGGGTMQAMGPALAC